MFDAGFAELVLLFIIGLLILGPERLPRVASQIGRWVGRARRTASQLRYQLEREVALNDIRRPSSRKTEQSRASADTEGAEAESAEAKDAGAAGPDQPGDAVPGQASDAGDRGDTSGDDRAKHSSEP